MLLNCGIREDSLRVPWTAGRSNKSILKEISPGCSLEGLMLKVKLWPPHTKSWLTGKDPDAVRDWGQEEKGTTEDEIARWHHRLNGHEFGWTPGAGDGQGGLACCDSQGRKESDTTERLNRTELKVVRTAQKMFPWALWEQATSVLSHYFDTWYAFPHTKTASSTQPYHQSQGVNTHTCSLSYSHTTQALWIRPWSLK